MDPDLMEDVHSLRGLVDHMAENLVSLDENNDEIPEPVRIKKEPVRIKKEPMRESITSSNTIIRFFASLCELSPEELKNTMKEANTILNSINPRDNNCVGAIEWNVDRDRLKTLATRVFDILNMLPAHVTKVDANNPVASTSIQHMNDNSKEEEEEKIQFWRRYKNKYNYIKELQPILPLLDDQFNKVITDVKYAIIQNDVNDSTQKDGSDLNILNNKKKYTIEDIEQSEEVYELLKSKLKNSPYNDEYFKSNVNNSLLTIPLFDGTIIKTSLHSVTPLILITKCDNLLKSQLQNKKKTAEQIQSTSKNDSNKINDSNSNNTTKKITNSETRANVTSDITNSFNTNVKTSTEKQRLTIKDGK